MEEKNRLCKIFPAFLILLLLLLSYSCGIYKKWSVGNENEIIVIADSLEWLSLKDVFSSVFEREIMTPQYEKIFHLKWISPIRFPKFTHWKNLLLVSTLDKRSKASEFLRAILDPQLLAGVQEGKYYVFLKKDNWARDQIFMVLAASNQQELRERVMENSQFLFDQFDEMVNLRVKKLMYRENEQKELEEHFKESYGWTFRVQRDYIVLKEKPDSGFVWLGRNYPIRWISIYWETVEDVPAITEEWVMDKRDEIGLKFYKDMVVDRRYSGVKLIRFKDWVTYRITGLWMLRKKALGGPFRTYCFYDDLTGRIYLIDFLVYAPGQEKAYYLRQLEIMVKTFNTFPHEGKL